MVAKRLLFVIFFLSSEVYSAILDGLISVPSDTFHNVSQIITSKGYPVEEYTVQTPDGYLLSIQRIPHGKRNSRISNKPVVLLIHGVLCDSTIWVLNNEVQSLAFVLADQGYDVWLGNNRGNIYSSRNVRLSAEQNEFWEFSFDEMAKYDQPSMIDYILNKTGQKQLSYIGHSQGTTIAFAMLSRNPSYNKKIKIFIALAPVTHTAHTRGLFATLFPFFISIQPFYKQIGFVRLLPHTPFVDLVSRVVCGTPLRFICANLIFSLVGTDEKELNYSRLPVYFNHVFSGTSVKEYIHYAQMSYSGKFRMYDLKERNLEVYNQSSPPEYDLSKITAPVALLSSMNDIAADPTDVDTTQSLLKSVVERYIVPFPAFNHLDFVIAIDAYPLVNKKVLSLLDRYGKNTATNM